jgi:hypothetical protein
MAKPRRRIVHQPNGGEIVMVCCEEDGEETCIPILDSGSPKSKGGADPGVRPYDPVPFNPPPHPEALRLLAGRSASGIPEILLMKWYDLETLDDGLGRLEQFVVEWQPLRQSFAPTADSPIGIANLTLARPQPLAVRILHSWHVLAEREDFGIVLRSRPIDVR